MGTPISGPLVRPEQRKQPNCARAAEFAGRESAQSQGDWRPNSGSQSGSSTSTSNVA